MDCAAELRDLNTLRLGLARLGEIEMDVPDGFADRVMAAVAALPAPVLRDRIRRLGVYAGSAVVPVRQRAAAMSAHRRAVTLSAVAGLVAVAAGLEARHLRRHKEAKA
jgi:hypothetical protein